MAAVWDYWLPPPPYSVAQSAAGGADGAAEAAKAKGNSTCFTITKALVIWFMTSVTSINKTMYV